MNTPIIDPSTLTEEQREEIKAKYDEENLHWFASTAFNDKEGIQIANSAIMTFRWLFGKEFFKEGE